MQPSNHVEDKTRQLQDSPMNCIEVIRAVETRGQRNSKDQPIQQKELNVNEKSTLVLSNPGPSVAPKILARLVQSSNEKTNSSKGSNGRIGSQGPIQPIPTGPIPVMPQFSGPSNLASEPVQREPLDQKPNWFHKTSPIGGEPIP